MKKRISAFILALTMVFAMALSGCKSNDIASSDSSPSGSAVDTANTVEFDGGNGSISDPYQISTPEQLETISNDLTASYILTDDIDLSEYENWTPIGNITYEDVDMESEEIDLSNSFSGTFDGDGHKISGLKCTTDKNQLTIGLFGGSIGVISNLEVSDVIVVGDETTMATGGVVGYGMAGEVTNVTLSGKNSITGINCIGGIVGGNSADVDSCTVEDAEIIVIGDNDFSEGLVQEDIAQCGGLIVGGGFNGSINNCTASGTVTAIGNEPVGLGGIAGCIQCVESITGNTVTVTINAENGHAIGGLCGYAGMGDDGFGTISEPCAITDCEVTVTINADGATHVGGLVGTGLYYYGMEDRFTVENCIVTGSIDGAETPGTVAGRAEGSAIISCETNVTIDGTVSDIQVGLTNCMYESADQYEDGSEEAAVRLLDALEGTYVELFPVLLNEKYEQIWIDSCADVVGEDNAVASAQSLRSACAGDIYGQEAINSYAENPESAMFDCAFINGVSQITVDGNTISGTDESGNTVFSHTYSYTGSLSEAGFYQFKSDDDNEDEFTYFCFAPDTTASTHHIEFRYGSDLEALAEYYEGEYAYWMAAGISQDYDDNMVANGIELFCTENLSE